MSEVMQKTNQMTASVPRLPVTLPLNANSRTLPSGYSGLGIVEI
jgi:hypothetical protein